MKMHNRRTQKIVYIIASTLAISVATYLVATPLWPLLRYQALEQKPSEQVEDAHVFINNLPEARDIANSEAEIKVLAAEIKNAGEINQVKNDKVNRIIIEKIGVNAPIIESDDGSWALNRGAWRIPGTSTPDKGSNTVISGHRFKYLPPNNLTFYLLDKLEAGDIFKVIWEGKTFAYKVKETKVVPPSAVEIQNPTHESIVTLFTCTPIFTTDNRLVVVGELIEESLID